MIEKSNICFIVTVFFKFKVNNYRITKTIMFISFLFFFNMLNKYKHKTLHFSKVFIKVAI